MWKKIHKWSLVMKSENLSPDSRATIKIRNSLLTNLVDVVDAASNNRIPPLKG